MKPPLTPIPVAGPFDRVGVDVIQYVKSNMGNQYAVVFIDFFTRWPEVYPVADQTTLTSMLAKTVEQGGEDWDVRLPYVLFAYRASIQE